MSPCARQAGLTLVELMMALAIAALLVTGLNGFIMLGLDAKATARQSNELLYQGSFALERIVAAARATAPKPLSVPTLANTTGDWFSPKMYCLKGGNRLVETTTSDTSCTGSNTVANNVIALSAQPAAVGPVDEPVGTVTLTLQGTGAAVVLTASFRLGAGTL